MTPWFCGKERPILCSAPDVMAILDGRKTQTRRIMKPQPNRTWPDEVTPHWSVGGNRTLPGASNPLRCPYGVPGDRLWVREAWRLPDGAPKGWVDYRADDTRDGFKWKPSIHMPRWASRITLEVTDVRVERLQDISEADAMAEGVRRRSART